VGGFNKWVGVATYSTRGQSEKLIRWGDLGDKAATKFLPFSGMDTRLGFWADGRNLVALGIAPNRNDLRLQACSVQTADYVRQMDEARKMSARGGPNAAYYTKRASGLAATIRKSVRTYEMDGRLLLKEGIFLPVLRFVGRDRLIFAKRLLHVGNTLRKTGEFGLAAGSGRTHGRPSSLGRRLAQAMNNIFSVSSCGNWAASGTHIYSVSTQKPVRRLPLTATKHVFSRDGRNIYVYDAAQTSIYALLDWQKNAPPVAKEE
jgi:hypothetical protein